MDTQNEEPCLMLFLNVYCLKEVVKFQQWSTAPMSLAYSRHFCRLSYQPNKYMAEHVLASQALKEASHSVQIVNHASQATNRKSTLEDPSLWQKKDPKVSPETVLPWVRVVIWAWYIEDTQKMLQIPIFFYLLHQPQIHISIKIRLRDAKKKWISSHYHLIWNQFIQTPRKGSRTGYTLFKHCIMGQVKSKQKNAT